MSDKDIKWLHERLGGIETPECKGDNLAIVLCTFFDDPFEEQDDNGWSLSAVKGCDSILDAIRKHYAPAFERLIRERDEARAAIKAGTEKITEYYERLMADKVIDAEARGYRRGVEDAIAAGDKRADLYGDSWKVFCRPAILALLEQPGEKK